MRHVSLLLNAQHAVSFTYEATPVYLVETATVLGMGRRQISRVTERDASGSVTPKMASTFLLPSAVTALHRQTEEQRRVLV